MSTTAARRRSRWPWVAAVAGVLALAFSLRWWIGVVHDNEDQLWQLIDLEVYREGGRLLLHQPGSLYTAVLGRFGLPFLYPPFAAIVFAVVSPIHFDRLMQLTTIASLVSLAASVWWSWGLAGRRRLAWRVAATGAVTAIMLWVEPVQQTLTFGQVNLILMAMVLGDLSLPDRSRGKGIATGLAAGFKLTPAVFLVYLAFTRRTRAAVNGLVTLAATVVLGLVVSPSAALHYWKGAWLVGDKVGRDYVGNQSVDAVLRRLVGHELGLPSLLLAVAVGVAGLALAVWAYRRGNELAGVVLIGVTGLLVSPISWTHHWVWVVPAVVLGCDLTMRRRSWLVGLAVVGVTLLFLAWPAQIDGVGRHDPTADDLPTGLIWQVPHRDGREHDWSGTDLIVGNLYVVLGLAGLAVAGGAALASSRKVVPSEDAVDVTV